MNWFLNVIGVIPMLIVSVALISAIYAVLTAIVFYFASKYDFELNPHIEIICAIVSVVLFLALMNANTRHDEYIKDTTASSAVPDYTEAPNSSAETWETETWEDESTTVEITAPLSKTSYWTPKGKSYHFNINCPSLSRSNTIYEGTLQEAIDSGHADPCNNCAHGS